MSLSNRALFTTRASREVGLAIALSRLAVNAAFRRPENARAQAGSRTAA
jgi:hypothetical protein